MTCVTAALNWATPLQKGTFEKLQFQWLCLQWNCGGDMLRAGALP
jgi:hypothetical protein